MLARLFVFGLLLFAAAFADEATTRELGAARGARFGAIADFVAYAVGAALLIPTFALAPVIVVVPLIGASVFLRTARVLMLAIAGAAVLLVAEIIRHRDAPDLIVPLGWGVLYAALAVLATGVWTAFGRVQRASESSYSSIATLSAAGSFGELAQILFAFAERLLDLPSDAPAVLLIDEHDSGVYSACEARGLDPESRARFRVEGATAEVLRSLTGAQGVWVDTKNVLPDRAATLPEVFRSDVVFVAALRDAARLVGFVMFRRERIRRLDGDTQAALAKLMEQAATTAIRVRGARSLEAQRQALLGFLDARGAGASEREIAAWLVRTARDVAGAESVIVLHDTGDGRCAVLAEQGVDRRGLDVACLPMVEEIRRRDVAISVADGAVEQRLPLPPFMAHGASVSLPVRGEGAYLIVHRHERGGFSSGDLQLLVMLSEQAALLFGRARAGVHEVIAAGAARGEDPPLAEPRLAAVAAHVHPHAHGGGDMEARVIDAFRLAVEGNQPELAGSGERIAALASALAQRLGLDDETRDAIYVASLLRDVGQLGIDRRVLETRGPLTADQREIVARHPLLGETILATLQFLAPAAQIIRSHHERWDGSGYPSGLRAEEIPVGGRIVAVADAFAAMTSVRPYRGALTASEALAILVAARGRSYDPAVLDALMALSTSGEIALVPVVG